MLMLAGWTAAAGCGAGFPAGLSEDLGFTSLVLVQQPVPANAGSLADNWLPEGDGRLLLLEPAALGGELIELLGGDGVQVRGLDVAPAGDAVVFAARLDSGDRYHLYRLDMTAVAAGAACLTADGTLGTACQALTFGPADDWQPFHLPGGQLAFFRQDEARGLDFLGRGPARFLYAVEEDGSDLRRLDSFPGQVAAAGLGDDGWLYTVRWSQRPGGSGWRAYRLDPSGGGELRPLAGSLENVPLNPVRAEEGLLATCTAPAGTWGAGVPCLLADDGASLPLVTDIPEGTGCSANGRVRDSWPLRDGRLLVSSAVVAQGCVNASDGDEGRAPDFSLAIMDPADAARQPLLNLSQTAEVLPRPLMSRSLLPEGQAPPAPPPQCQQEGVLVQGYLHDAQGQPLADAVRVRVYTALDGSLVPWRVELGGRRPRGICGSDGRYQAEVYADGSFGLRAPADTPLQLAALDAYGVVLAADPEWRGGPSCSRRSCSGCHAGARALDMSASLAGQVEASDLADPEGWRFFDFRRDIQPILDRSCAVAGCHDSDTAAGSYVDLTGNLQGLDLTGVAEGRATRSYNNLLRLDVRRDSRSGRIIEQRRPYVEPGSARDSRLIQRLGVPCRFDCSGRPPWAEWALGPGRQHPEDQPGWSGSLSDQERWLLVEWIDCGAPFVAPGAQP